MSLVNKSLLATVVAAGAASFGLASTAIAATAPAADTATLDEIIVTASRREESLQDVPMSVDVATGETLQKLAIFDVKDVQQLSPGLELTNTTGRNNSANLRGISFDPDSGASPAVDVYFNEVPVDAQTVFTAMYDLDQIEVLRGPQGALRGRTAPSGAITMATRRPDLNKLAGYAMGTVTNRDANNVQGAISVPLVEGVLAIRIAGLEDSNRMNQVRDVNTGKKSRSRTQSGRLSLAYKPSDDFNLNFMYQYLHADNYQNRQVMGPGSAPAVAFPTFAPDPTRSGPPATEKDYIAVSEGENRYRNSGHLINLNFDWNLGPVTLSFVGGHQDTVLLQDSDLDAGNAVPGYIQLQRLRTPYKVENVELRLLSNNDGFWNWTLGATYSKTTGLITYSQPNNVFFVPFSYSSGIYLPVTAVGSIPSNVTSKSVAASSRFKFTDALTLELAARYTKYNAIQSGATDVTSPGFPGVGFLGIPPIAPISATVPQVAAAFQETKENPVTGGATLTYKVNPDVTTYVAYGRSFRAPTAAVALPSGIISSDLVKTKSEKSDAIELGVKTTLAERYSLNADVFYQKFDNFMSRFISIPYDYGTNVGIGIPPLDGVIDGKFDFNYNGDATVKGLEATFAGRPIDNWDFQLSGSYIKARWDNARLPCDTSPVISPAGGTVSYCVSDDRLSPLPDLSLTANSEVRFPVGTVTPYVRGLINYRPSVDYALDNYKYASRTLINLFVGVRGTESKWDVNVFVKNLLDEQKVTRISASNSVVGPYNSGYRLISTTSPREFGLTASYNF